MAEYTDSQPKQGRISTATRLSKIREVWNDTREPVSKMIEKDR